MNRALVWIGGAALLGMTAIDTLAVFGRNLGWPIHGSIELIQAAVLIAGGIALLAATLAGNHARVHVLLDRLSPSGKVLALRTTALIMALFFAGLLAGSLWLAADLWLAHEQSELRGVPWRWLRLIANLCLAACMIAALRQAVRGDKQ